MRPPTSSSTARQLASVSLGLAIMVVFIALGSRWLFDDAVAKHADEVKKAVARRPVIILTGFEPFGDDRPDNPSWEGIKGLHEYEWRGYRLICKQLPVVWGAPRQHLQRWIDEYQPAAIFSFGQGGKGGFKLESRACNDRKCHLDNLDEPPATVWIAEDGPAVYQATTPCDKLARWLAGRGYATQVSTSAGQYLCEETLYTLEYLKSTRAPKTAVAFCHVPPLGSKLADRRVTREYVQEFVEDFLEAWYAVHHEQDADEPADQVKDTREQQTKEIKEFIGRYFSTWSNQDMKGYDACFLPDACIQHVDGTGQLTTYSRVRFIASQRDYHRNSQHKTTEVPETIDVRFEGKLARVIVYWKLTAGPRTEKGYDHFTLMKHDGNWRIVNLVFYATD